MIIFEDALPDSVVSQPIGDVAKLVNSQLVILSTFSAKLIVQTV
jgi:hypothetical protein